MFPEKEGEQALCEAQRSMLYCWQLKRAHEQW